MDGAAFDSSLRARYGSDGGREIGQRKAIREGHVEGWGGTGKEVSALLSGTRQADHGSLGSRGQGEDPLPRTTLQSIERGAVVLPLLSARSYSQ